MPVTTLLRRYVEAWIPPSTGFSPYRMPGFLVSVPVLVCFLLAGWVLCGWDPRLWIFLPFYFVAGFALGPPIAIAAHYNPLITLVVLGGFGYVAVKLQAILAVHAAGALFGVPLMPVALGVSVPLALVVVVSLRSAFSTGHPLHRAVRAGDAEALMDALGGDADPHAADRGGLTALHLAAINLGGSEEPQRCRMAAALLEGGADVNARDGDGWTPLHHAAEWGQAMVTRVLLEQGADPHAETASGLTPLSLVGRNDDESVTLQLLAHGADVNALRSDGSVLLHRLGWSHQAALLRAALERGGDTEARDDRGRTALHTVWDGNAMVTLLGHGADPHARDDEGRTPLHVAAGLRDDTAVAIGALLEAGAELEAADGDGLTPFLQAVRRVNSEAVGILMAAGADVTRNDARGRSALHVLAEADPSYAMADVADLLLDAGCDARATDQEGRTPLDCARKAMEGKTYGKDDLERLVRALEEAGGA